MPKLRSLPARRTSNKLSEFTIMHDVKNAADVIRKVSVKKIRIICFFPAPQAILIPISLLPVLMLYTIIDDSPKTAIIERNIIEKSFKEDCSMLFSRTDLK